MKVTWWFLAWDLLKIYIWMRQSWWSMQLTYLRIYESDLLENLHVTYLRIFNLWFTLRIIWMWQTWWSMQLTYLRIFEGDLIWRFICNLLKVIQRDLLEDLHKWLEDICIWLTWGYTYKYVTYLMIYERDLFEDLCKWLEDISMWYTNETCLRTSAGDLQRRFPSYL